MNVGSTDKTTRLVAGAVVLAIAFFMLGGIATTAGLVATVIAAVLVGTALFNFCPLYKLLGLSTRQSS